MCIKIAANRQGSSLDWEASTACMRLLVAAAAGGLVCVVVPLWPVVAPSATKRTETVLEASKLSFVISPLSCPLKWQSPPPAPPDES